MKIHYGALVANAAALGLNWIYDMNFLENLAKNESLVFQAVNNEYYEQAKPSYLAYPNAKIGQVSLQGEILKWLYSALSLNSDFSSSDYLNLLVEKLCPGGNYQGYVESYGKKIVYNDLIKQLKLDQELLVVNDDQLVGFVPYIVCKSLNIETSKAIELLSALTLIEDYAKFFVLFDKLLEGLTQENKNNRLETLVKNAPSHYKNQLEQAIHMKDSKSFINLYSGTACHIKDAIPLIIHIMYHSNSYEEAITKNILLGGASSDRGMLIGALYCVIDEIPKNWLDLTLEMNPLNI
jgi:hypothetical protein